MIYDSGEYGFKSDGRSIHITFDSNWVFSTHTGGKDKYAANCPGKTFCSTGLRISGIRNIVVTNNIFAGIWDKEDNESVRFPASKPGEWPNS